MMRSLTASDRASDRDGGNRRKEVAMTSRVALVITLTLTAGTHLAHAEVTCSDPERENAQAPATTPSSDFELHGDGTVTHLPTGLMWRRCTAGQQWSAAGNRCESDGPLEDDFNFTWEGALGHVRFVNEEGGAAGHTDWRLPNRNELESIVELRCWDAASNAEVFPNTVVGFNEFYWTSSPYSTNEPGTANSWAVDFADGAVYWLSRFNRNRVRLVRDADPVVD